MLVKSPGQSLHFLKPLFSHQQKVDKNYKPLTQLL